MMGHVKEPKGVDFIVDPTPLTKEERMLISDLIAHYKRTGKKKQVNESKDAGKTSKQQSKKPTCK
jgi:hypothetical protein